MSETSNISSDQPYDAIVLESPISEFNSLIKWLRKSSCRQCFCTLSARLSFDQFEESQIQLSLRNWVWLKVFWQINSETPLKPEDFETLRSIRILFLSAAPP